MKNKLYLALAFCILLTGCATSDQKVSVENPKPSFAATPEIVVNSVIAETSATPQEQLKTETVKDAVIISDNANLRETGSSESLIIDTIPEGAAIEVLRQKGAWFFVRVDEKTGWLHGNTFRFGKAENTDISDEEFTEIKTPPVTYTFSTPVPLPKIEAETKSADTESTPNSADTENTYSSTPTNPDYTTRPSTPDYTPNYIPTPGVESVRGYTRRDGTYVAPYKRTKANSTTSDNGSTRGNVNPYTGKRGSRRP